MIQDTSAFAKFHVTFECIVFRPFKGEVLDCVVTSVNKACPRAIAIGFFHSSLYRRAQMGFFAEAGPMQVFVSNYVRPRAGGRPHWWVLGGSDSLDAAAHP